MRIRDLTLLLIIALLAGNLCAGCWNRREPELLGVVLAVGFDYDEVKGLYRVIAQLANPIAMGMEGGGSAGSGGSQKEKAFWTTESGGHTPYEAIRNLVEDSSRELFWAHCRVVLFSEKLARRGLGDVLDLLERGRQFRLIAKPVVILGDLRKILEADFPLEETGARGIDRLIVTTDFDSSIFPEKNLNEAIATLSQPGKEMIIGRLVVNDDEEEKEGENGFKMSPARIGGSAIFRGDRMVGWADNNQTHGWSYATGRSFRSTLVIESPAKEGSYISIGTFGQRNRMLLHNDKGKWRIELRVKMHGRVQEYDNPGSLDKENELIRSLDRRAAAAVRNRIESALSHSQELKADIFGFGNLIYRKDPKLWQEIGNRWDEEIFPRLTVDLVVEFRIMRTGLVTNPL